MKCVLIETKDGKQIFIKKQHLNVLAEYIQTFKASAYVVEIDAPVKILTLKQIPKVICQPANCNKQPCQKLERIQVSTLTAENRLRSSIRNFIRKRLTSGRSISMRDVVTKYEKHGITDAVVRHEFSFIKDQLATTGHVVVRNGVGSYCLQPSGNC